MKSSLKLTQFPTFHIDDPTLQTVGAEGQSEVDWYAYPGERVILENIEPGTVDWSTLPEVIVEYVPLFGERILINPFAGGRTEPLSTTAAGQRAKDVWQSAFKRPLPDSQLQQTDSASVVLDFLVRAMREPETPEGLLDLAQQARALYDALRRTPQGPARVSLYNQLRATIRALVAHPRYGRVASGIIARIHPLALWGQADPQVPFIRVVDPELLLDSGDGMVRVNHEALNPLLVLPQTVYVPLSQFYAVDWVGMPRVVVERDAGQGTRFIWNPYAELAEWQAHDLLRNPLLMQQYARHVADQWQAEYGERPQVHVSALTALPPEPWRLMIDPEADLAAVPRYYLRHNEWITLSAAPAPAEQPATPPAPGTKSAPESASEPTPSPVPDPQSEPAPAMEPEVTPAPAPVADSEPAAAPEPSPAAESEPTAESPSPEPDAP